MWVNFYAGWKTRDPTPYPPSSDKSPVVRVLCRCIDWKFSLFFFYMTYISTCKTSLLRLLNTSTATGGLPFVIKTSNECFPLYFCTNDSEYTLITQFDLRITFFDKISLRQWFTIEWLNRYSQFPIWKLFFTIYYIITYSILKTWGKFNFQTSVIHKWRSIN